jgi:hypothetical protein
VRFGFWGPPSDGSPSNGDGGGAIEQLSQSHLAPGEGGATFDLRELVDDSLNVDSVVALHSALKSRREDKVKVHALGTTTNSIPSSSNTCSTCDLDALDGGSPATGVCTK